MIYGLVNHELQGITYWARDPVYIVYEWEESVRRHSDSFKLAQPARIGISSTVMWPDLRKILCHALNADADRDGFVLKALWFGAQDPFDSRKNQLMEAHTIHPVLSMWKVLVSLQTWSWSPPSRYLIISQGQYNSKPVHGLRIGSKTYRFVQRCYIVNRSRCFYLPSSHPSWNAVYEYVHGTASTSRLLCLSRIIVRHVSWLRERCGKGRYDLKNTDLRQDACNECVTVVQHLWQRWAPLMNVYELVVLTDTNGLSVQSYRGFQSQWISTKTYIGRHDSRGGQIWARMFPPCVPTAQLWIPKKEGAVWNHEP